MGTLKMPETASEFQLAIGRAAMAASGAPATRNEEAIREHARQWCRTHYSVMVSLKYMAGIALRARQPARSIAASMGHRPQTMDFLRTCRPAYFGKVVRAGLALRGQQQKDFLQLLWDTINDCLHG